MSTYINKSDYPLPFITPEPRPAGQMILKYQKNLIKQII